MNTRKKLKSLRHEIEKIGEDIQTLNQERNDRANELIAAGNELSLVFDRKIKGINKRLLAANERLERFRLGLPLLELKLKEENLRIRDKVLDFLQNELDMVERTHAEKLQNYREEQKKLQVLQKEVGDTYQKKRVIGGLVNTSLNLLTLETIENLQTNPTFIFLRNPELKNLFSSFPELAEAINEDISKAIKDQDLSWQKEQEQKKKEKAETVAKNRSLFSIAEKWFKAKKFPRELACSIQGLSPDILFHFWKDNSINPERDYDASGNRILRRAVK